MSFLLDIKSDDTFTLSSQRAKEQAIYCPLESLESASQVETDICKLAILSGAMWNYSSPHLNTIPKGGAHFVDPFFMDFSE